MSTTPPALSQEVALNSLAKFFSETPFVFFGTGLSCAVDRAFGMPALQDALTKAIAPSELNASAASEWEQVKAALSGGRDLESALNEVSSTDLLERIRLETAKHLMGIDQTTCWRLCEGTAEWPAAKLMAQIVEKLPEGSPVLHVLTPNYDLLFEHAMERLRVPISTGFHGCINRRLDWDRATLQHSRIASDGFGQRLRTVAKPQKHLRLYKVHGSLSYFYHENQLVENLSWAWAPPPFANRVMVTPGQSKFAVLQSFRRELQAPVDQEIDRASSFLFLGYGFNDTHLENYIRQKLVSQQSNALILTKDLNPRIESLATDARKVWVVTAHPGTSGAGCRIYNSSFSAPLILDGLDLWRADVFAREVLSL
jgi:hypothetical protein